MQLAFTGPTELVTITLLDLGDEGTQLAYHNEGAPLGGRAQTLAAVERMLDALAASLTEHDAPSRPSPKETHS